MTSVRRFLGLMAGAVLALASVPAGPALAQALSPAVGRPLQAAQGAARAGNTQAAIKSVDQARAAASTPAERRAVAQMAAYVHTRAGNYARAAAELEAIGAPPSQLAPLYYQARQYDKAIAAAQRSGQLTIVAQSYLQQGKAREAAAIYQKMVAQNPNNLTALQNLAGAQYKMGDKKGYIATTQRLVRLDPTPERWRLLLADMKNEPMSREAKLGLYHLMNQTGAIRTQAEVEDFAKNAIVGGQPGYAEKVVREAMAAGIMPADSPVGRKIVEAAAQRSAEALKSAPKDARSPETAMSAGNAFLGAGRFPEAAQAYAVAEKGPMADKARLFRGISVLRSGDRAQAKAIFDSLSSGPMADVASLWSLYASTRG
ncbi:MAG: tetratricopeptide repeat protein [Sphingomonadaceae bacterium]|uniref:tetratricopeptide repeat protein n=1 Tax=Thermaurantiacus sp. TaxID=2820283 RepID=UPI00298F2D0A|nr:tetratricopeptide repeat protein [Thermaurantiacus sp.]MCS6987640.1 tetratricopeptide repeat protein [Sphingomonadaceae bacterium]MDW8415241.1 tetratricopeptide repeat protein [Thermaurantiacus sp.]